MDKTAIRHAWERLHRAQIAHERMKQATTAYHLEAEWSAFIIAASGVYSKLEKGSKGHSKAEPWFGRIKKERKSDPLLSYVHHARNCDEHGIENIAERPLHIEVNGGPDGRIYGLAVTERGEIAHHPLNQNVSVKLTTGLRLGPVTDDRFGDTFAVPDSHLGKPLTEPTALSIAALALEYLDRIVREGSEFAK